MRIHALQTGRIEVKQAFLHARAGWRRRVDLVRPGKWVGPLPIHAWLIEHHDERILVDTGERADPKDPPFSRSTVTADDELPHALRAAGFTHEDVTTALVTHMHPDHYGGAGHLRIPVLVPEPEWQQISSLRGRVFQRISGAPLPPNARFEPIALDDGAFGAFAASRRLTPDGRVMLVATPGHTPGHASVIAIDDKGRHVVLAGDATDTLEQLHARRADAIAPDPEIQRQTIDRILAHTRTNPTIYLPAHDPESTTRLTAGQTV